MEILAQAGQSVIILVWSDPGMRRLGPVSLWRWPACLSLEKYTRCISLRSQWHWLDSSPFSRAGNQWDPADTQNGHWAWMTPSQQVVSEGTHRGWAPAHRWDALSVCIQLTNIVLWFLISETVAARWAWEGAKEPPASDGILLPYACRPLVSLLHDDHTCTSLCVAREICCESLSPNMPNILAISLTITV